jgi:PAS domain S-box-containing protein
VRLLANPVFLRGMLVMFSSAFAFLLGLLFVRTLRKNIAEESDLSPKVSLSDEQEMPLHIYNTVIQQLKQQKHELLVQSQAEQQRARTSENFSQAVLSNLSCGVLAFGVNGLVKTSNAAARTILGFASMTGMSATDIFSGAVRSATTPGSLADEVHAVLREGSNKRQAKAEYESPAGEKRFIAITVSPVPGADGERLGVACLISDLTELANIRKQQELHGEMSAEMALQLRASLATISGYAQQLAQSHDAELAKQLAADIAQEASQLDRSLGGFLTARTREEAAAASSASS